MQYRIIIEYEDILFNGAGVGRNWLGCEVMGVSHNFYRCSWDILLRAPACERFQWAFGNEVSRFTEKEFINICKENNIKTEEAL